MLSVIVPSFNEENRIALFLADIKKFPNDFEILLVDGGSRDLTINIAKLAGAKVFQINNKNRGLQLKYGSEQAKGEWLLFLHSDSRLSPKWSEKIISIINSTYSDKYAWFFDLKIKSNKFIYRFLELAVYIRSNYLKKPYGDQGLLIHSSLYNKVGGFKPLNLMEDIDLIKRLRKVAVLRRLKLPIYTDPRKWEKNGVIYQAFKNAKLRYLWHKGLSPKELARKYYEEH